MSAKLVRISRTQSGDLRLTVEEEDFPRPTRRTLYIDEEKIGKGVLTPGWTSYNRRLQYQTYDVKQALKKGSQIKVSVANGWAVGYIGFEGGKNYYAESCRYRDSNAS